MLKQTNPFYKSAAWLKCRELALIRDHYLCQPCYRDETLTPATIVHHIKELEEHPELELTLDSLESECASCHNKLHPEKGSGVKKPTRILRASVIEVKANREVF